MYQDFLPVSNRNIQKSFLINSPLFVVLNERNQYFATDSNRVVPSSLFSPKNCDPRLSLALGTFLDFFNFSRMRGDHK